MDERLDDLAVYTRLVRLTSELDALSRNCWSVAAAVALYVAARQVRVLASGLWRVAQKDAKHGRDPQRR